MGEQDPRPFVWKGRELTTYGDIAEAVIAVETTAEAREFMAVYRAITPHADANVGYLAGYYDRETRHRIFDWFGVEHPIFGTRDPTPEEALQAGMALGRFNKN